MPPKKKNKIQDLYRLKRKFEREKRDIRKEILGIDEDHKDTSLQRIYGEATKTRRALKVELFGSKSKASATEGEETSIEAFIREILLDKKIKFVEQKAIRFINVDFLLPDLNLVIQVHGTYWHCDPRFYKKPKNKTQRKNIEKDKQANSIIEEANYNLLDIWEHDIKKRPQITKDNLNRIFLGDIKSKESSLEWK